ncbi:MAG: exopolysaccharide biosynthesis polyprenyl glycosylphosphotransferase [bacterium]|nr:exopolysaccharide biosynthesis polyprenyl glycosylphosphotransferase [bacterium]MDD5756557.1 exopolysaccharide biosynthesis polyprenyl glycosylphosphotransferase [bacterium]
MSKRKKVIIYGSGEIAGMLIKQFQTNPGYGYYCRGLIIDVGNNRRAWNELNIPVLGTADRIVEIVKKSDIDELIIAHPNLSLVSIWQLLSNLQECKIPIWLVSHYLHSIFSNKRQKMITSLPAVRLNCREFTHTEKKVKRIFEFILALILLIITLPIWITIALLIKITSPGPVFFRQERVGYRGRLFKMFKFRTMFTNVEKYATAPSSAHDRRITCVGRWLRHTSLDELPQLINVLKGDMGLVGPRPEMPFIVAKYQKWHKKRLNVIPGVTGLWQVLGRTKQIHIHECLEFDLYYILNQSLLLDIKILGKTIWSVIKGNGAC